MQVDPAEPPGQHSSAWRSTFFQGKAGTPKFWHVLFEPTQGVQRRSLMQGQQKESIEIYSLAKQDNQLMTAGL